MADVWRTRKFVRVTIELWYEWSLKNGEFVIWFYYIIILLLLLLLYRPQFHSSDIRISAWQRNP